MLKKMLMTVCLFSMAWTASAWSDGRNVLQWKEITSKKEVKAAIKRDRLYVSIILTGDQSKVSQNDLAATVMQAAETYHVRTDIPVITVKLLAFAPTKNIGETLLAYAVYIPDQKGPGGKAQMSSPWETLTAVPRGFTTQELEYFRLYESMYDQYINQDDGRGDKLHQAVCKKLGVKPADFQPMFNFPNKVEPPTQKKSGGVIINVN